MLFVKYRDSLGDLLIHDGEIEDEEEAQAFAASLREKGFRDVEVLVDLDTADQTARAMSFTPCPKLLGTVEGNDSRIAWRGQPMAAAS